MPSTAIQAFHYEKNTKSLVVVFISGTVYRYINVPETIYKEMKQAFSKGIFLNTHIKGAYKFEKIE